jgi:hypothetical protein
MATGWSVKQIALTQSQQLASPLLYGESVLTGLPEQVHAPSRHGVVSSVAHKSFCLLGQSRGKENATRWIGYENDFERIVGLCRSERECVGLRPKY